MEKPRTRYARSGDVFVAYQAFGEGPFDLVVIPGFLSNIEYGWEFESWRNYYGGLASFARVLLFDKRGTGISDPVPRAPSIEERMDDVRAVMDAAGSDRAAVIGSADGAAIAAVFAAAYPERTAALILNTPQVRGRWAPDYPWGDRDEPPSAADLAREMVSPEVADEKTAARLGGEDNARLMESYERLSASPTTFANLLRLNLALDVREVLSTIRAPTLVTHIAPPRQDGGDAADDDELFSQPVEQSRYDAGLVRGEPVGQSRYVADAANRPGPFERWAVHENTVRNWEERGILRAVRLRGSGYRRFSVQDVERLRAEMFEQLAPAIEGPVVNPGRKRTGRLVFGDATD